MDTSVLAKKTKAEIIEEYNQLQKRAEELKDVSRQVHESRNQELITRSRSYDANTVSQLLSGLKASVNSSLNQLYEAIISEVKKFQELQQASEVLKKELEVDHAVRIVADSLANLMGDYEAKKKSLTEELENSKRDWEREKEEYEYTVQLTRRRDRELYEQEVQKREVALGEREQNLRNKEVEFKDLQEKVASIPSMLEREAQIKQREISQSLEEDFKRRTQAAQKEHDAAKALQQFEIKNLRDQLEKQSAEIASLKKETEQAAKKAQELAVKVIEGSSRITETAPRAKQEIQL